MLIFHYNPHYTFNQDYTFIRNGRVDVFSFTELTKKSGHPRHGIIKSMKKRMIAVMYVLVE